MGDPFNKVNPGDSLSVSAGAWNAFVDVARAHRAGELDPRSPAARRDAAVIRVRNDSGGGLARRSVIGLDGPLFTPTDNPDGFLGDVVFKGVTPASSHVGRFAVLIDPIPEDGIGRAWLAGVCQCKVDITSTAHDRADAISGDAAKLRSGSTGSAQVLWYESQATTPATGVQWAIVRLGTPQDAGSWFLTTGVIAGASGSSPWTPHSGSATRVRWNGTSWSTIATGQTLWTGNEKTIDSGSYVYAVAGDDGRWWITTPDKCSHLS